MDLSRLQLDDSVNATQVWDAISRRFAFVSHKDQFVAKNLFFVDHVATRRRQGDMRPRRAKTQSLVDSLVQNGFVHLGRLSAIDVTTFNDAISQRELAKKGPTEPMTVSYTDILDLPGNLAAVLSNRTIRDVVKAYLGDDAAFGKAIYLRLSERLRSARDFPSGTFHHDRLGRRLRLFVLLSNSTAGASGRSLVVARGSHHLLYPQYLCGVRALPASCGNHFTERFVHERFDLDRVGGLAGEAYLFDTNTLHRGSLGPKSERRTLMFTFGSAAKMRIPHLSSWATKDHLPVLGQVPADSELHHAVKANSLLDTYPHLSTGT